jgi:sporulation-control protein
VVFKSLKRAFGAGGPTVDTVLANPNTRPGLTLDGQVQLVGGDHESSIEHIVLGLVAATEHGPVEFHRVQVAGAFRLAAGERRDIPFQLPVPWETPVTHMYGQQLHGMTMGVRTELAIAKAIDKGDLDMVAVHPLPVQERILEAFDRIGFRFTKADLEHGQIYGVRQTLPFYQEIEFYPSPQYAGALNEAEVTFIADPQGVEVVLEFDKRGGFLSEGHDSYGRFRVAHQDAETTDFAAVVNTWVSEAAGRYQSMRGSHGFAGVPGYGTGHGTSGHGAPGHGTPGYGAPGHGGMGTAGAVAAGVAGGVVGGMILGEVAEEVFEDDGGGEDFEE